MKGIPQDNIFSLGKHIQHNPKHPHCPYYTTQEVLEQQHYFDYTGQIRKIIDVVTLQGHMDPVGSSRYAVHKYPSDIDMFEPILGCCTVNKVRFNIAKRIQGLVERIRIQPNMFFSRFQAGYDRRYDVYLGKESNGMINDYSVFLVRRTIENYYSQGLLTNEERQYALSIAVENPTVNQFMKLYWFFRERMIIDWSADEIREGYKILPGKKTLYLDEALIDKSLVKLDVLAEIDYSDFKGKRFMEVTNWFLVEVENEHGDIEVLSIVQEDRVVSLRADIFKYIEKDPLKAAKRYWNYLFELKRTDAVERELVKLAPLFSSYVAFLNSVLTDIITQKNMLRRGLISRDYYTKFIKDVRLRMRTSAPGCMLSENNIQLMQSLDLMEMRKEIARLTQRYLQTRRIDILDFVRKN